MGATTKKEITAADYTKINSVVDADCYFQAPANTALYLVLTEAAADAPETDTGHVDYVAPEVIRPGEYWGRTDTANNEILQGEVWLRADLDCNISYTE